MAGQMYVEDVKRVRYCDTIQGECFFAYTGIHKRKEPCALRSTQPLKMSTGDFFCGKGGRCVWLTAYHFCGAISSRKSGALTYPEPLGPPRPVAGDLYFYIKEKKKERKK